MMTSRLENLKADSSYGEDRLPKKPILVEALDEPVLLKSLESPMNGALELFDTVEFEETHIWENVIARALRR
jgi:hypothetical protein